MTDDRDKVVYRVPVPAGRDSTVRHVPDATGE
jgi:hypothetical protein